ncbi:MAG: hypothetical protein U9Q77_03545 [Candidatus Marinimicrobia bacterium]|nr:hypothetical protein [Candidatus Neomarinimicrobiota bacterium]
MIYIRILNHNPPGILGCPDTLRDEILSELGILGDHDLHTHCESQST